ncbi:hypothetical protein E3O19_01425 [Cryobacterium algoritolerans]|uniref:Uncharacterized protein n=1 Tax=Cryobacterium algoritolerans TaxID=1259184 RepID=A0A4R8WX19_9MICO|nr:hypothetical protein [Cryobacterium algoritolerans]TFC20059.1 hypothetical protein E3O19_01425 [Cryobacterium algoritolerans]
MGASNREALAWHKEEMAKLEAQELTPDELRVATRALLLAFGHRMAKGARQAKSQNSVQAVLTREVAAEIAREHQSEMLRP